MTAAIRTQNLGVTLGGRRVLDGVDLTFAPGALHVVIGPNGAGKSTLLSCLAGLRPADNGDVRLGDQPLDQMPPRQRSRQLALLPQMTEIAWPIPVASLVGLGRIPHQGPFGPGPADRAAVIEAMDQAGVTSMADRLVTTLSGGERARALIARALAGAPDWILADEPLTGLDPAHALDALALFRRLTEAGRGVILTLHDLSLAARFADRIVVLGAGAVLADGPVREALTEATLLAAFAVRTRITETDGRLTIDILGR